MRPEPLIVEKEALARQAAAWLARELNAVAARGGRCGLALSGGSTTGPVYRALAEQAVPWERVDCYFVDERCVPPDHPDSNYLLAEETLFKPLGLPSHQVFRMQGERPDRDGAARDYEALLPPVLDVAVVGLGEDGHTASLFPGASALEEQERRVLAIVGPKPPPWRLTLTLPVLRATRAVLGVVSGAGKRDAVRRLLAGEDVPAGRLAHVQWMFDKASAAADTGDTR
jgi:6-phosphogluconolactonase